MSERIGRLVLEALGLSGVRVTKLSLHFDVGHPVVCRVESFADGAGIDRLAKVLQDFELVKREKPAGEG